MLNINTGIKSLTEFKQNSSEILSNLKKTHSPTILTVNGRAEVVLLDPETYQNMVEKLYLAESSGRIEERLLESNKNKGVELEEFFDNMTKKHTKNKPLNDKKL